MFSKLLAYHNGKHTEVYTWRNGALSAKHVFNADAEGIAEFTAHLATCGKLPLYFLVDVIEEDFRLETIPHLFGRSRAAMINRKLAQAFRNETHRHTAFQGRETVGRRDDRLLLSALTNNEALKPWLDGILASRIPLVGLYSVPLLSQGIIRRLGLGKQPHLLLLSLAPSRLHQDSGGLRQSYFQNGHLKFSRLVFIAENDPGALVQAINAETVKIQQYLNNQRLLPRDHPLEIHLLCQENECAPLLDGCDSTPLRQFVGHPLEGAAAALGLRFRPETDVVSLFLQFLAHRGAANHYAVSRETRFWMLDRAALAMKSSGIALVVFGALSAAIDIADSLELDAQTGQTLKQAEKLEIETRAIRSAFPALPAPPDVLKETVELAESLTAHPHTPEAFMTYIGAALDGLPKVRPHRFAWALSTDPDSDLTAKSSIVASPSGTNGAAQQAGELFEVALLEGEIVPFTNYREALAVVEQLTARLRATPGLQVTPLALPIETGPAAQIKGSLNEGAQPAAAKFSLKLAYRVTGS